MIISYLRVAVILNLSHLLRHVLQGRPQLRVLCVGEIHQLFDQLVRLVPQLGRLPGVGRQDGAELPKVLLRVGDGVLHELDLGISAGKGQELEPRLQTGPVQLGLIYWAHNACELTFL